MSANAASQATTVVSVNDGSYRGEVLIIRPKREVMRDTKSLETTRTQTGMGHRWGYGEHDTETADKGQG